MNDDECKELKAQTNWFHLFKSMIDGGDLAKMSGSDLKVYLVVKSHTNFNTGKAFPSLDLIGKMAGISLAQVKRCLTSLVELGYILKQKQGRKNIYTLREKIECTDEQGRPAAVATWDYLPAGVKEAQAELKNFLATGDQDGKIVHIKNLTINVAQKGDINNVNVDFANLPPDLAEKLSGWMNRGKN